MCLLWIIDNKSCVAGEGEGRVIVCVSGEDVVMGKVSKSFGKCRGKAGGEDLLEHMLSSGLRMP